MTERPLFSYCVVTHNRPALCFEAVKSLLASKEPRLEVVVLVQAKSQDLLTEYQEIQSKLSDDPRILFQYRNDHIPCSPGQSRNVAAGLTRGDYIGFLDDDDLMIDSGYLSYIRGFIEAEAPPPMMICARQQAAPRGADAKSVRHFWLDEGRAALIQGQACYGGDIYPVSAKALIGEGQFCHVNSLLIHRLGFEKLRGFDKGLYYEEDREFFYRAAAVLTPDFYFVDRVVAHHHIPEPEAGDTASNRLTGAQKRVFQMKLYTGLLTIISQGWFRRLIKRHIRYTALHQMRDNLKRFNLFGALWAFMTAIFYRFF